MESVAADIVEIDEPVAVVQARARSRPRIPSRLVEFYELTKPRMNFLVVITTMVGYYMAAAPGEMRWLRLAFTLIGTAMCAAAASALNQLIERRYDALMPRTRNRPLITGHIQPREALVFGITLGALGVVTLAVLVNALTAFLGGFTLLTYVAVYTPLKRVSTLNTVVGAIPGAIPPLMGFTAVDGALSPHALTLFGILFLWQMPHFLAIAILYKDDYAAGGFRMLPNVDATLAVTSRQIVLYGTALIPMTLLPMLLGMAGPAYFTAAVLLGLAYLSFGVSVAATRTRADARQLFFASIVYLPLLFAAMMYDKM